MKRYSKNIIEAMDFQLSISSDLFETEEEARKRGQELGLTGVHKHNGKFMPGNSHEEYLGKVEGSYRYEDPKTGEIYTYKRQGIYKKDGRILVYRGADK